MDRELIILGDGGHARVLEDIARTIGYNILDFVTDEKEYFSRNSNQVYVAIGIGENAVREKVAKNLPDCVTCPVLAAETHIQYCGCGTSVMPGVILNKPGHIGEFCILNSGCIIEHDCVIEDFVFVAPGAVICGGCKIGKGAFIGAGATVIQGIAVGEWSVVGAGSVVTKDINPMSVNFGVPCRERGLRDFDSKVF